MSAEIEKSDLPAFYLTTGEEVELMNLAAVGFTPKEIAAAMKWPRGRRSTFCRLAEYPGSDVASLIAAGRAEGRSMPQTKLREQAKTGNVEAIKELQTIQARNRFNELVSNMDDDEFNP